MVTGKRRFKLSRSAPVLLLGFGLLLGLIALSGVGALRRARETYHGISTLNDRYRRTDQVLNSVASGIYSAGLLARDYLLDPGSSDASDYRSRLLIERSSMENAFLELKALVREQDLPTLERLRREVGGYWDALNPLFAWTTVQRPAQSWRFLRTDVLPRRRAALSIALEISKLTKANLDQQRQEIDRKQGSVATLISRLLAATVLLGIGIAGVTVWTMAKLENRSEEQRLRTEAAEGELRRLSRQLVQAQEDERKSLSRELHDEVGQMLTALRMELRSLQELRNGSQSEFTEHMEDAKRLAEQSLRALKDLAMGLRPSMLDDLGLGSTVQWQARQFSKHTGIPVNVQLDSLPASLPDRHRTCIYRLVQEALTNCARHAGAKSIHVSVVDREGELSVDVKDDGVGFDPSAVRGRGLGLIGMQERVMELGGELRLVSKPYRGTSLSARIPFRKEATQNGDTNSLGG